MNEMNELELKFIKSLANQYPDIASASTEIINLQSILNLPKGTEHFLTDIHGEYEQFNHVLKNGSGAVRRKIDEVFENSLSNRDIKSLATLIYYPREKLDIVMQEEANIADWYKITLHRLGRSGRMGRRKCAVGGYLLVDFGVIFHGARPEGIKPGVDTEIIGRHVVVVAHHRQLVAFRKPQRLAAKQRFRDLGSFLAAVAGSRAIEMIVGKSIAATP